MSLILRLAGCAGALFLAVAWIAEDPTSVSGIAGAAAFTGLASTFLVQGLWRGFWIELLAAFGALLLLMSPEALMAGFALTIPALFILIARQWNRFQSSLEATP